MGAHSVIVYTVGQPGSGKSFRRCAWFLIREFLKDGDGVHWSNFPIKFEDWKDRRGVERAGLVSVAAKRLKMSEAEVRGRVRVFPAGVLKSWERGGGPWEFFDREKIPLDRIHIAIDEIHHFCGRQSSTWHGWDKWLGEIRHEGATVEFLTQHEDKVHNCIAIHAGERAEMEPSISRRDFMFGIQLGDWYNLATVVGCAYRPSVWQIWKRRVQKKWEITEQLPFWFDPSLFGVYDSYSAPQARGAGAAAAILPYQRYGRLQLVGWFVRRNWWRFFCNPTVPRALAIGGIFLFAWCMPQLVPLFRNAIYHKPEWKAPDVPTVAFDIPSEALPVEKGGSADTLLPEIVRPGATSRAENGAGGPGGSIQGLPLGNASAWGLESAVGVSAVRGSVPEEKKPLRVVAVGDGFVITEDGQRFKIGENIPDRGVVFDVDFSRRVYRVGADPKWVQVERAKSTLGVLSGIVNGGGDAATEAKRKPAGGFPKDQPGGN